MPRQNTLETDRLLLRSFTLDDVDAVQKLASAKEVAANTLTIPHPYTAKDAEEWIRPQREQFENGENATFAITQKSSGELIGAIGLVINQEHQFAELGYWIGKPFWNQGYCTEAALTIIHYGFKSMGLHRIFARVFKRNPASGRVLEKAGMQYEGCLREAVYKWNHFEDLYVYGILASEVIEQDYGIFFP